MGLPVDKTSGDGEKQYIGYLELEFDSDSIITEFTFDWQKILDTTSTVFQFMNNNYDSVISADYETGITPYRIQTIVEESEFETIVGFAHDVEMPTYTVYTYTFGASGFTITVQASVPDYSQQEEEALENQFSKQDFDQSLQSQISNMANSVYAKMTINSNQDFVFNKSKKEAIAFKDVSAFEAIQQEKVEVGTVSTSGTTTTGGSTITYGSTGGY